MFEDVLRELKRLDRQPLSIPVEADEDGYFDRECPNEECLYQFKVTLDDWGNGFEGQEMTCPLCGKLAPADHYWTTEHLEQAKEQAIAQFSGRIGRAMSSDARRFNRRQPRNSLISMSMEYKGSTRVPALVPLEAAEEMQLKIDCGACGARYAVIGSAFFCPKCGHSSAIRVFEDALKKVEAKVTHLDRIVQAVGETDKDAAELTRRSLLESGISDAVVAFQRVMEELYKQIPGAAQPNRNAFQRLQDGSKLWEKACGTSYGDVLSADELQRLGVLFQRRHLLAHQEGIVDEQYIQRSGDSTYGAGQRIVVRPADVSEIVGLVRKLVGAYMPKGVA